MSQGDGRPGVNALSGATFRGSLAFVVATYVGYPVLALTLGRLRARPHRTGAPAATVSVLVAAHNEAAVIADKIRSVRAATLPGLDVEIVVVDDGSTDGTARQARDAGATTTLSLARAGKARALEAAVAASSGEILVFTDANSIFEPGTLTALLAPLADPAVGAVAGDQRYTGDSGSLGERVHWAFDRMLKQAESRIGSTVSATGALYAIRRIHVGSIPEGVTDDFYISTGAVASGARLVFAADAVVTETAADSARAEYARKVRVMTRGLHAVQLRSELLSPRYGFYAVSLFARKVARRLTAPAVVLMALASLIAPRRSLPSRAVASGTAAAVSLGAVGWFGPDRLARTTVVALPTFACVSVAAALEALWNTLRGTRLTQWSSDRATVAERDTETLTA